jgi:hypothetical protein
MDRPAIHLYLRHFVHDAATLERYRDIVFRTLRAANPQLVISAVVGFSPGLSADHRYQMFLLSRNLLERNIAVHHIPGKGAGHAFLYLLGQCLPDASAKKEVICLLDADQFPFDDIRFLQQIDKLASSMHREARLVGLGLRDRISLGEGRPGKLREIEEMFHALFVRRKVAYKDRRGLGIPSGYKELGDPVPGCYCFNLQHPKLPALLAQAMMDARKADLWRYAGDPYAIMLASTLSRFSTEVVPTHDNPPGSFTLQDIERKSRELGRTSLGKRYLAVVKDERSRRLVERYYPAEDVAAVREMIIRGLRH